MSELVVRGGEVMTPAGRVAADVVVQDGRISAVVNRGDADPVTGTPAAEMPPPDGPDGAEPSSPSREPDPGADAPVLDATGLVVAPGFVDLQCNGAGGIDLTTTPERLWEVAALLPRWGVTAWLPTIVTSPEPARQRALVALRSCGDVATTTAPPTTDAAATSDVETEPGGETDAPGDVDLERVATPLGLHFEGPFLASSRRGVHVAAHLRAPDPAMVAGWSREAGVAVVTLAPELPGSLALISRLVDRGVVVSLGHSGATANEATAAVDSGARWVTHLFNAMGPLHHRDPGLAGVALTDERLSVGIIADGLHLHPRVVRLAARALGPRLTLVSDAVAALGVPAGLARLGDAEALADDEGVRLADGRLAGSILSLDRAVSHFMDASGASLDDAVAAVTVAPARLLGVEHERGVVAPGAVGDLVLLDPERVGTPVVTTVIGGRVVYAEPARSSGSSSGSPPQT